MRELTDEEYNAMKAFKEYWTIKRCHKAKCAHWREALGEAWLNDWSDQWGTLRRLRNCADFNGFAGIFRAFAKREKLERVA